MTRTLLLSAFSVFAIGATASAGTEFATVDVNADGFVSETEFVSWATASGELSAADALIKFIEIDTDASGMISEAEMKAAMDAKKPNDKGEDDTQM
ncbi:MAG: hypothetical protein AAF996_11520 [Pseudomonadota bacterium]